MATKKIPLLDLMFFLTETAESPKHVGAVQIFQKPARAPESYMRDLVSALKEAPVAAPFNLHPHFPRIGFPEWRVDDDLEIDYHVRHSALPQPGTHAQLLEVLQRLHVPLLDRDRPGWICQVIEGLEGNRFAVYSKIHHAYIDGMSGVKRMYGSLSTSSRQMEVVPSWSYVPQRRHKKRKKARMKAGRAVVGQARALAELSSAVAKVSLDFIKPRETDAQTLFHAPRTRMNNRVEFNTRTIATCSLPLDRARDVAAKRGGKVNDVILSVIDAALNEYLEVHSEVTEKPLVALCPMSLREEGDETATTQATVLHIRLGRPEANPGDRLQQIIESSADAKQRARAMSTEALMDFTLGIYGAFELIDRSSLKRLLTPSYNALVSNVPGPAEDTLYMRGSKQLASYPISAFLPGGNLNITILSHGKKLDFGMIADKHALPDLQFVAGSVTRQFAELEKAVLADKGAKSRTGKTLPTGAKTERKKPAGKKPVGKKSVSKKSVSKKPAGKKPVRKKPARKKTAPKTAGQKKSARNKAAPGSSAKRA